MLQTFGQLHQFWPDSGVHGKLIATCRPDFTNKYITATLAVVGGVFRFRKYRHNVWYRAWNCGTKLQIFGYMHEFWSGSGVHGKLIAAYRHDFRNKYITATRALVGGVFRLLEISTACVVQSLEMWTGLHTFGYLAKMSRKSMAHGLYTCSLTFTINNYNTLSTQVTSDTSLCNPALIIAKSSTLWICPALNCWLTMSTSSVWIPSWLRPASLSLEISLV